MRHIVAATKSASKNHRRQLLRALLYHGLFARVARQLRLGPNGRSHVRRVALGERHSKRVERALADELRRIDRGAA